MKPVIWTCAGLLSLVLFAAPITMLMVFMKGASDSAQVSCGPGQGGQLVQVASRTDTNLSQTQLHHAATIIAVGREMNVPTRGQVIALAVAHQESRFLNYANSGDGAGLKPEQKGVVESLSLPHDAVGNDHGSVGIFQQQFPWWGTLTELMDPATAARKFYEKLLLVPGWLAMSPTQAGQAVQHSAYPNAYADDVPLALNLLSKLGAGDITTDGVSAGLSAVGACPTGAMHPGTVVMPIPKSAGAVDQHNWNSNGGLWTRGHTGTDFSVRCGTPVLATHDGIIQILTDRAWSGRWLVKVTTGKGRLTTWYAHMQALTVVDGQQVRAGQQIGEVGSQGNSTGCHLHFEVHPRGGSIYEDDIDPSKWLAANVGKNLSQNLPVSSAAGSSAAVLITSNVRMGMSAAAVRSHLVRLLAHSPDVVMLQEVRKRDIATVVRQIGGNWTVWQPPPGDGRSGSALIWKSDRFALVQKGVELGERGRYDRWMTWALLQDSRGNSLPVIGLHMPVYADRGGQARRMFDDMTRAYLNLLRQFGDKGYAPIVGGDWNAPLHRVRYRWEPVQQLRSIGFTTNWLAGRHPCSGTSKHNARIDGFALNPAYVEIVAQGCLDRGHSDHRPVWMQIQPTRSS